MMVLIRREPLTADGGCGVARDGDEPGTPAAHAHVGQDGAGLLLGAGDGHAVEGAHHGRRSDGAVAAALARLQRRLVGEIEIRNTQLID